MRVHLRPQKTKPATERAFLHWSAEMGMNPFVAWLLFLSTLSLGASKVLMDMAEQIDGEE